jgi:DNA-binding NtrC family response regulator
MTGQPTRGRVLVVDDDRDLCALLALQLGRRGFHVTWRTTAAEALEVARTADLDAVLTDLQMDGMNGLELCERIVAVRPDVPVAVLTAFGSLETAVSAIRAGAYDFITKPPDVDALEHTLGRAVAQRRLREELRRLPVAGEMRRFGELLGNSPAMQRIFDLLQRVVGISAAAARRLLAYAWPGNVRELQNCIERAAVLARYDHLTVDDLPERVGSYRPSSALLGPDGPPGLLPLAEVERRHILRVLELVRGNKTLAAQALGLDRKTLRRKLARGGSDGELER